MKFVIFLWLVGITLQLNHLNSTAKAIQKSSYETSVTMEKIRSRLR